MLYTFLNKFLSVNTTMQEKNNLKMQNFILLYVHFDFDNNDNIIFSTFVDIKKLCKKNKPSDKHYTHNIFLFLLKKSKYFFFFVVYVVKYKK